MTEPVRPGIFRELLFWYEGEAMIHGVTFSDIMEKLPAFWRAINEKLFEMEKAYFAEDSKGINEAMEKIKKLYQKAVERIKK